MALRGRELTEEERTQIRRLSQARRVSARTVGILREKGGAPSMAAQHPPYRRRRAALPRRATMLLILLLATTGCIAGQPPQQLRWDLRQSHTKADVGWQDGLSAHSVPHADITILLPGGHTFVGQGVEIFADSCRDQNQVCTVQIHLYPEETIDHAYQHAKQIAQAWHFQTADLDRWYQDVLAGRQRGVKDRDELLTGVKGGAGGPPLAPGGPTASLGMLYSFDEQRPVLLDFEVDWTGTCPTC